MKKTPLSVFLSLIVMAIGCRSKKSEIAVNKNDLPDQFIVILGTAQDAGYPQAGCEKECCAAYWQGKETKKLVTCLALVDRTKNKYWLFEATPDMATQLHTLRSYLPANAALLPNGIFITHAHIGHYTGLMQLGREAIGAGSVPVFAMPRMDSFLRNNGPWSQLVKLANVNLQRLKADSTIFLDGVFKITPVQVPHRDEFSETVGFIIEGREGKVLFIPDIDKWEKWSKDVEAEIYNVDMAIVDGTFFADGEVPGRDMKEVPHPFVEESMRLFSSMNDSVKTKIVFIHFNHTNPLLKKDSKERKRLPDQFGVAEEGMIIKL